MLDMLSYVSFLKRIDDASAYFKSQSKSMRIVVCGQQASTGFADFN